MQIMFRNFYSRIKRKFYYLFFILLSCSYCFAISSDSLLVKIRNHEFENVSVIIKNQNQTISDDQKKMLEEINYYNSLVSEFGIYKGKPLPKIKSYDGKELKIEAIHLLNKGLYMLLYEYDTESEAFEILQKALSISEKTKSNILTCEILKAILFYYSRIVEIENNDYKFYSNLHKKYAYDDLEYQIQKIYYFYLQVEFKKPNFTSLEISEMSNVANTIKNPFYNSFANKAMAIFKEIQEKKYPEAIVFYNRALSQKLNQKYGINFYFTESELNCKADCLKKMGRYEEATYLFLVKQDKRKGKTADWLVGFKYSMLSDLYAVRKVFDSAFYYRMKSKNLRNEFQQTKHDAIINQLNSNIKDQEIDKKQKEITSIQRKYAMIAIIILGLFSLLFIYRWKQNKINKIKLIATQEKIKLNHQNQLLQNELDRQKSIQSERERISHDMHDDLGAGISALKLQTEFLKEKLKNDESLQKDLDDLLKTSADMNLSMREMLWNLNKNNDTLQNLVQYISTYAENFFSKTNIKLGIENKLSTHDEPISSDQRWHLFLCVKEALNNIYKHSKAQNVLLKFDQIGNQFIFEIIDNGIGLRNSENSGNGFKNMNYRMQETAGKFEIPPSEKGLHLRFCMPI